MLKSLALLHCCCFLAALAVSTQTVCADTHSIRLITHASIQRSSLCAFNPAHHHRSIRRTSSSSSTILFSSKSRQPKSKEQQEKERREAREDVRNLRSFFKVDEDNTNSRPSISNLQPEQLRQLRREIIGRRRRRQNELDDEIRDRQDYAFIITALVPCFLAFWCWEDLSRSLAQWVSENSATELNGLWTSAKNARKSSRHPSPSSAGTLSLSKSSMRSARRSML